MPKLPVVSGSKTIKLLSSLGYEVVRQRGSHIQLRRTTAAGDHTITMHGEIAKGTLNDILSKVSIWCGISKDALIDMLENI